MSTTVVSREVAQQELTEWLDYKKIRASQRDPESIDFLAESIQVGDLVFNEDHSITHRLLFPLENDGQVVLSELKYKPRLNDNMLRPHLNGVKANDADGRILAYLAALTSQPKGLLSNLDTGDRKVATYITFFFL